MSQAPASASGLVRVTVASGTRRVDLVLPGAVPVAELVPELARSVGLLDPGTVYGGYRLVTREGRELASDAGLAIQGIEDGGLITVTAGVDDEPPRVYDDVVEAMTDVVERDLKPWEPASGRRTALTAAALLMALGAVALFIQDSTLASVAAAVVALALVTGAIVLSRAQHEAEAAVAVAWMGAFYAAVAGFMLAPDGLVFGLPVAYAGAGAAIAGLACLVGLGRGTHADDPARGRGRDLPGHRPGDAGCPLRPRRRADHSADGRGDGRQHLPLAGVGCHRHDGRPALLDPGHHHRSRRRRPRSRGRRRAGGAPDPGRGVGHRRTAAGDHRAARGVTRSRGDAAGGRVLPGRDAPHASVPHRLGGARRAGLGHRRAAVRRDRTALAVPGVAPDGGARPGRDRRAFYSRSPCCRPRRRSGADGSAISRRA